MSDDAARAAIARMKVDAAFHARVRAADGVDARLALLVEEGYECSAGEFEAQACELSDDALDFVSGADQPGAGAHHLL